MQSTTAKQIPLSTHLHYRGNTLPAPKKRRLVLHTESHIEILLPELILFVEAQSNYSIFHLSNGRKVVASKNLGSFENYLAQYQFIRCHQSYLVNPQFIRRISKLKSMVLILDQGNEIPVSRRHRKKVLDLFLPSC
jgi:two-component system LytT family response regulator